jgi:16S rRNA (cytosine967-C5)-methyltransferase
VTGEKPREIAVSLLLARDKGEFIETLLDQRFARGEWKPEDRRFLQELIYGVARWQLTLDWLIIRKTSGKAQKPFVQNVLRVALYQMFWLDRVPSYAAVNESVEYCKKMGRLAESRFVNAVLRAYGREAEETRVRLAELKKKDLARGFSHPEWLCRKWEERWGKEQAIRLLEWNNSPPPTFARVNHLKTSAENLIELWRQEGVEAVESRHDWFPEGTVFELKSHPSLARMASFLNGLFYIQDPSTLLAPRLLGARPGDRILDLCAAPGGKTTYIAQLIENDGFIQAEDINPNRLKMVDENATRLGATAVKTGTTGVREGNFDRILIDAPCSNTGVMRRRIELRWRIKPEEIQRLAQAQLTLLKSAVERLKPGGTLVYSTCSLEREENEAVVREFLTSCPRFTLQEERQITPMQEGVDGAYCARFMAKPG